MSAKLQYLSAACNPVQHCLSVQDHSFAYGACNAVIFGKIDAKNNRLAATNAETGHTDRVNCVRFFAKGLLSGSTDKTVCLWQNQKVVQVFRGHEGSVTVVDGLHNVLVSASTDSTLRIWNHGLAEAKQVIPIAKHGFVLDLALIDPHGIQWIIASLDDCTVHLYCEDSGGQFQFCHRLKGHEDWVQSLSVTLDDVSKDVLLASGGQDGFVRVWRFQSISQDKALADQRSVPELGADEDIEAKADIVFDHSNYYTVTTDTILSGHDDKVFGVRWSSPNELLTASMDKTMIFWEQKDNFWSESVRVGEVGGNTLGFLGCALSSHGAFLGYTFSGALHLWSKNSDTWSHGVVCGGHFGPVQDLDWDPQGHYLVSTSQDQTTRIHAVWPNHGMYIYFFFQKQKGSKHL